MVGTDDHSDAVRHDQPDESDRPREGDDAGGEQRRAHEHAELQPLGVDAELQRRLLAEREHIELTRLSGDEPEADRPQHCEHGEPSWRDRADVAEEPVDDAAQAIDVHQ